MDASSLTKKQKQKDINCSGRSLISELPHDVLFHIVSFLPAKEAFQTSILSKSWESMWTTSIPELEFAQGNTNTVDFINSVERAFILCRSPKTIKFFLQAELLASSSQVLDHVTKFTNLRHLQLDGDSSVDLLKILQSFPCLKYLVLSEGVVTCFADASRWNPVPPCFVDHLDYIYIWMEEGNVKEFKAIDFLLNTTKVLKTMLIHVGPKYTGTKMDLCIDLCRFSRKSRYCSIQLNWDAWRR